MVARVHYVSWMGDMSLVGALTKKVTIAALLTLILLPAQAGNFGSVSIDRLVRVYDGDTIYVDIDALPPLIGQNIPVRVRGVDTPEIRSKCDQEKQLRLRTEITCWR